jgi:hypothetical protein
MYMPRFCSNMSNPVADFCNNYYVGMDPDSMYHQKLGSQIALILEQVGAYLGASISNCTYGLYGGRRLSAAHTYAGSSEYSSHSAHYHCIMAELSQDFGVYYKDTWCNSLIGEIIIRLFFQHCIYQLFQYLRRCAVFCSLGLMVIVLRTFLFFARYIHSY